MRYLLILFLILTANTSFACGFLNPPNFHKAILESNHVFIAKVIDFAPSRWPKKITVVVNKSLRGDFVAGQTYILNGRNSSCSNSYTKDTEYLFNLAEPKSAVGILNSHSLETYVTQKAIEDIEAANQALKGQPSAAGDAASGAP